MNKLLEHIDYFLADHKLSADSQARLDTDLNAIYSRLKKNEYETSGIVENVFDIPNKTHQLYQLLFTYTQIAHSWEQVLQQIPLLQFDSIVDVCPGFAPKIEIALAHVGYTGDIFLLDTDEKASEMLSKFSTLFNPTYKLVVYNQDFFSPPHKKFSLVLGNHIIDDLILRYYSTEMKINLQQGYQEEKMHAQIWSHILRNSKTNQNRIVDLISKRLASMTEKNGYVILSNYKSYIEEMLDLHEEYEFSFAVFEQVVHQLQSGGFTSVQLPMKCLDSNSFLKKKNIAVLHYEQ